MTANALIEQLNATTASERLAALAELKKMIDNGELPAPKRGNDVNNHIHTIYSFSPYSPTKAVWMAYQSGLITAGIMDHDSISGAEEFIEAGEIIGMATTIGVECRADMSKTALNGKKINNPDQCSIAYMALHGIPHTQINRVKEFFKPYTAARNVRNAKMVANINELIKSTGIVLSFEDDVRPLSCADEGGSITERHVLFALANKMIATLGKGEKIVDLLENGLNIKLNDKAKGFMTDLENPHYAYDLLGILKSDMVEKFYIPATDECPDVTEVIALGKEIGAISAYAYLGDVGDSVTGDKKTQKFEDDYIDLLFEELKRLNFNAVTYMPTRNTLEQLMRLKDYIRKNNMFEISGEDINSPRQVFICKALEKPEFQNLITSTWALIGHEKEGTKDLTKAMFSDETVAKYPNLDERVAVYAELGQN
ncbi:MAG: PHP domain-containing protein [Clostridia bacterium]|nr:PHP domain-containing protein [Clostridia bacterium]